MTDPVPGSISGKLQMGRKIIAGDESASAAGEAELQKPTRAVLQADIDDVEAEQATQNNLQAQLEASSTRIKAKVGKLDSDLRDANKGIKYLYSDEPEKWERYGIENAPSKGKQPQSPIAISVVDETPTSVTIAIEGGEGADRFELKRRRESEPPSSAIVVATDIRPRVRQHTDSGLTTGERYIYTATAHNAYGDVGPSNDLLVTP